MSRWSIILSVIVIPTLLVSFNNCGSDGISGLLDESAKSSAGTPGGSGSGGPTTPQTNYTLNVNAASYAGQMVYGFGLCNDIAQGDAANQTGVDELQLTMTDQDGTEQTIVSLYLPQAGVMADLLSGNGVFNGTFVGAELSLNAVRTTNVAANNMSAKNDANTSCTVSISGPAAFASIGIFDINNYRDVQYSCTNSDSAANGDIEEDGTVSGSFRCIDSIE